MTDITILMSGTQTEVEGLKHGHCLQDVDIVSQVLSENRHLSALVQRWLLLVHQIS